jgi:predicted ATPase
VEAALSAIAWALGTDRDSLDAVVPALEAQPYLLLVLDNVEQLPPAFADLLGRIRADARRLRILTTSRHRLGLPDEWAYPLEPLPVPASATELADSPAFALLALIAPGTALRSADPDRVVALLQALEGLPLAVELAAARLEILEVDELVARLDDRFAVLSDPHDSGERHGSLLAALDASWGLLAPDERRLLTHLSSFVAPFSADLVERVTDLPEPRPILDRLAARSLVVRRGPRFLLLVAVRAFADRKLAPDERRALYLRHAAAWAEVARALRRDTAGYREAWRRMTESAPEFSAVLDRARTDPALVGPALACAVPLIHLALRRGPLPRALELAESAVTRVREPTDHLAGWCDLRILQALALRRLGRTEEGAPILAALLARDDLPPEYRATAHAHLADAATDLDDLALAEHHSEAGLRLAREHGPAGLVATLQANLAAYAAYRGEAGSAFERFEAALASVPPGDRVTELEVLKQYAWARLLLDDVPGAEVLLQRIRELAAEIDDRRSLATAAGQLGLCAEVQGALARAEASYEEAVALMTGQREQRMRAFYDAGIGRLWLRRGREREGLDRIERSGAIDLDGMGTAELRLTWAIGAVAVGRVEEVRQVRLERGEEAVRALIEARTALDRLDRAGATAALARFDRELPPIEPHARAAVVAVVGQLRDEVDAWWIAGDGRWIEAPDGPRVDTERPAASARILARLARERVERPGRALDAATLADAGWPGERLVDKAASNRVSVALTGLRKVGLDALLVRDEAGWMLDPGAPVRLGVGPG